tara:strand:- start:64 stop:504 length:441 start_codon:yes stop_codon:yes gene_type:complete
MFEYLVYLAIFIGGVAVWLPIYYYMVSRWVGDHVVARVESKDIDLAYLLDNGGVFDELADRVVTLFKHHMLAEMGQLSRSAKGSDGEGDPIGMGIEASGEILKSIGMKKPPAILQYKLAQVLGQMVDNVSNQNSGDDFQPPPQFGP